MKHAGSETLDRLEPLLAAIRAEAGLKEPKRGVFYRKSKAFLHFHDDPTGLYADLRAEGDDFERFKVDSDDGKADLLARLKKALAT